ncbi:RNA-binding domain-containing [Lecanosticta acicola]|uniref:RNA-binding domain-containing n=1 Tax=Lecanosticta acicola TaxID=111012 RepID=A0AAI8Z0D1_9PEZI|nr:RNA-binding domain-containing [Lecanosticta acicola]
MATTALPTQPKAPIQPQQPTRPKLPVQPSAPSGPKPNQSIYIQNLPDKLQKHDLKRNLYMLFSSYGPILDITTLKTAKMRGQAHILFRDVQSATQAMRGCQGFEFFGKEMKISYAKSRSNMLAKLTGTFTEPGAEEAKTNASQQPSSGLPAPPGTTPSSLPAPPASLPPPPGMSNGPVQPGLQPVQPGAENAASPAVSAGTKRTRDDSDGEEDDGEAPMEESDDGGEMEMSDDD